MDNPGTIVVRTLVGSVVRTVLATTAGGLIVQGLTSPEQITTLINASTDLVVGVGIYVTTQIWSLWNAHKAAKATIVVQDVQQGNITAAKVAANDQH